MGKSLEELLAEIEKRARERVSSASETLAEPEATVFEESSATVPESNATVYEESDATVPEREAISEKPLTERSAGVYAKGQTILDTYTVASEPIHGGMGSVWRVHHNGWNVDLAMKRPKEKLFQSEKQKENFIGECEAWINLGLHPNIVSCYYVREIDGVPTIFSEWMENGSLKNHIQKGTLYIGTEQEQQERLLDIAIQFGRGLHYAHEQGLIHQDVKPDNVLLSKDWDAKVADFGLARARATLTVLEGVNTLRDAGATVMAPSGGYTPAYCSLEQMDKKPLTRRTDIYSWAVSVLEMYLGERLWENGVVAGLSCESYFPDCRVKMPEELKSLLKKCMEAEAEQRPHDFAAVEKNLTDIYNRVTGNEYPHPAPKAAADTADSLNNRALSYLDMGKTQEAIRLLQECLRTDSHHAFAGISLNLLLWRKNQKSTQQLETFLHEIELNHLYNEQLTTTIACIRTEIYQKEKGGSSECISYPLCRVISYNERKKFSEALDRVKAAIEMDDYATAASMLETARNTNAGKDSPECVELGKKLSIKCERSDVRQLIYVPGYEDILAYAVSVKMDEHAERLFVNSEGPEEARLGLLKKDKVWQKDHNTVSWLRIFDTADRKQILDKKYGRQVLFVSSDGKKADCGYTDSFWIEDVDNWGTKPSCFGFSYNISAKQKDVSADMKWGTAIGCDINKSRRYDHVWVWNISKRKLHWTLTYELNSIESVSISDDGQRFAVGFKNRKVEVFDTQKKKLLYTLPTERGRYLTTVLISGDGNRVAKIIDWNNLFLYDLKSKEAVLIKQYSSDFGIDQIWFSPRNEYVIAELSGRKKEGVTNYGVLKFIPCFDGEIRQFRIPIKRSNEFDGSASDRTLYTKHCAPPEACMDGNYCLFGAQLWQIDWEYRFPVSDKEKSNSDIARPVVKLFRR